MNDSGYEALIAKFAFHDEPWFDEAACKGMGDDNFILDRGKNANAGKRVCATCPVTAECFDYAQRTGSVGIWGGHVFAIKETQVIVPIEDNRPTPAPVDDEPEEVRNLGVLVNIGKAS